MSRETINEARIWCDGCGLTYLEIQTSVEIDAMKQCGWISRERNGGRQDLCPACRPDSPFEAVERVREVPKYVPMARKGDVETAAWISGYNEAIDRIIQALEGDSDE